MNKEGPLDAILNDFLVQVGNVAPYDSAYIFLLVDGEHQVAAARDLTSPSSVDRPSPLLDDELAHQLLVEHQPVVLNDPAGYPSVRRWFKPRDVRSWIAIPLVIDKISVGYMTLDSRRPDAFGDMEVRIAQALADLAVLAVQNTGLKDQVQNLEEVAQRQTAQLKQLLDVIPDGVLLIDSELRIVQANGAARAYLAQLADAQVGRKLTQLGNRPLRDLLGKEAASTSWQELTSVEPRGVFEVSAQSMGQEDGWLLLIRNVTATRKREGYLRAQERLSSVGQLAAGIAHDFNNTMAIISLYTQLVMRTSDLGETDRQRLSIIRRQAQNASDLIRQILDFSRQSVVDKKPMDLLPFIRETARALRQSLPANIAVETSFEGDEYLIQGDSGRLSQVFSNLAVNAVDAMPEGGQLSFTLASMILPGAEPFPLPDMTAGDWICLTVADTGQGIAAEVLPRVFEPFYSTKPPGQGSGLGLAQVYGIVKLHDGFIDVDSQPGRGTTFSIYLPAFTPPTRDTFIALDDGTETGSGETILIVEDDQATREALAEYMTSLNYHVLTAANGREALAVYKESGGDVQLVLTDMVMPVMDGATLYGELKQSGGDVRMIVITGYPLDTSIINLLEQEAVSFIQKPLRVESVARAVREALRASDD